MGLLDRFRKKQEQERLKKLGTPAGKKDRTQAQALPPKEKKEEKGKDEPKEKKHAAPVAKSKVANALPVTAHRILLYPIITEKITKLGAHHQYAFAVATNANKLQIKRAVSELYGVTPLRVRIMNRQGKYVRYGRSYGKTKDWKKAIITLKEGETIHVAEGV